MTTQDDIKEKLRKLRQEYRVLNDPTILDKIKELEAQLQ